MSENKVSRRKFLENTSKSIAGVCALAGTAACSFNDSKSSGTGGGSGGSTAVTTDSSNLLSLTLSEYPNLANTNGSYRLTVTTNTSTKKTVSVTRISSSSAVTVSATCPHTGCTVASLSSSTLTYDCPCHSSTFNTQGVVQNGPATSNLTTFTTEVLSDKITVQF